MVKNQVRDEEFSPYIQDYVKKVLSFIPNSKASKNIVFDGFLEDIKESLRVNSESSEDIDLIKEFGTPKEVAKNICQSVDWIDKPVSLGLRTGAFFIDFLINGGIYALLMYSGLIMIITIENNTPQIELNLRMTFGIIICVLSSIIYLGYYFLFEWKWATSPGKRLLHLWVCDESGIKPTFKQIFIRNVTKPVPFLLGPDILLVKIDNEPPSKYYRLLDEMTRTIIVKI